MGLGFWRHGHAPDGRWLVVHSGATSVVLSCGCTCGGDKCGFTLAPDPRDAVAQGPAEADVAPTPACPPHWHRGPGAS